MVTGIFIMKSFLLFIAADNHSVQVGCYQYYINNDDITKKHYSSIFDNATGELYHKTYTSGLEKVDM